MDEPATTHHGAEPFPRFFASKQEPTAPFEQKRDIIHVCARKIVQADFEDMKDNMYRYHLELGQIGQEGNILGSVSRRSASTGERPHLDTKFSKFFDYILLSLQVPKLFFKLQDTEPSGY